MPKMNVAEDVELYYQEYGSGDAVVLSAHMALPPGDSYQKRLGEAGFHVYSLQLRGVGESTHVTRRWRRQSPSRTTLHASLVEARGRWCGDRLLRHLVASGDSPGRVVPCLGRRSDVEWARAE
jgi:pimeloyl-ACP methyl ester carboxylesterase